MASIKQNHYNSLHFLIIGGGICGLSAAIALRLQGHQVTVFEQDNSLDKGTDGGCRIPPNMYKILREWGLESELQEVSSKPEVIHVLSYQDGEYLSSIQWDQDILEETNGEFRIVSESSLRAILYKKALSEGARVHLGTRVVSINASCPSVTLERGEIVRAEVLVGADGANGLARRCVSGGRLEIRQESPVLEAYSASIPKSYILDDPELAYILSRGENDNMFVWIGHGYSALAFAGNRDLYLYVFGPESTTKNLGYILHGAEASLRRLSRLACSISNPTCTPLRHEDVLEDWIQGCLIVIGDAAHPLPPGSAQKYALAVEDGAVLASLFRVEHLESRSFTSSRSAVPLSPYIPVLLAAFQSIRHPRCAFVQTKEIGIIHYMTMPGIRGTEPDVRMQRLRARRDEVGRMVVPEVTRSESYHDSSTEHDTDLESESDEWDVSPFDINLPRDHMATRAEQSHDISELSSSPEWVEAVEIYGYEVRDEAEEWWINWGRFQILPGTWNRTACSTLLDGGGDAAAIRTSPHPSVFPLCSYQDFTSFSLSCLTINTSFSSSSSSSISISSIPSLEPTQTLTDDEDDYDQQFIRAMEDDGSFQCGEYISTI
ncbi:hypothetical protein D9757_003294 [Collybiopsis confluens]|uniref:FAD-binding domain-containing protein n=1 Tax=Collybiopsis confluens TaxID=2823264 RepID=A0A8H5MF06_9AGAR|nr:hypothetical protein D9757_003294 [Collybiopsis confluens]